MSKHRHWTLVNKPAGTVPGRNRPEGAGQPGRRRGAAFRGPGRLANGRTKAGFSPAGPDFAETGAPGAGETAGSLANIVSDLKDGCKITRTTSACCKDLASAGDGETSGAGEG